jgi:hypothetical protein
MNLLRLQNTRSREQIISVIVRFFGGHKMKKVNFSGNIDLMINKLQI